MTTMAIADIKIGKRHRRDMGDIDAFARNLDEVGLLHPVVVRPDGKLIAGERRLRAAKVLGWTKIPITVVDLKKVALGEYAENTFRKAFTPSEMVEIADAIEPIERERAKDRQGEPHRQTSGKLFHKFEGARSRQGGDGRWHKPPDLSQGASHCCCGRGGA